MASIDKFNDHCWKDVIPQADLQLYAGRRRETFVGPPQTWSRAQAIATAN